MPYVGVTFCDVEVFGFAMVDNEVKCFVVLASLCGLSVVFECAALGVGSTVPSVGVAFGNVDGVDVFGVINGQVKRDDAIAAVNILERLAIVS